MSQSRRRLMVCMEGSDDKLILNMVGKHHETYIALCRLFQAPGSHPHLAPQLLRVHWFKSFSLTKILSSLVMCWATIVLSSCAVLLTFVRVYQRRIWLIGA